MREALSVSGNLSTFGSLEVVDHAMVEGEQRGRRTNFSTHVADRSHTRTRERLNTRTLVLNNSTSTALDSKDTSNLENDIFR